MENVYTSSSTGQGVTEISGGFPRNSRVRNRDVFERDLSPSSSSPLRGALDVDIGRKRRRIEDAQIASSTPSNESRNFLTAYSHIEHPGPRRDDNDNDNDDDDGDEAATGTGTGTAMRVTSGGDSELTRRNTNEIADSSSVRPIHPDAMAIAIADSSDFPAHLTPSGDEFRQTAKNSHAKAISNGSTNGSATNASLSPKLDLFTGPLARRPITIARVNPPGTALYPGSSTNREEFVRLVIQTMKDIGYLCVSHPFLISGR